MNTLSYILQTNFTLSLEQASTKLLLQGSTTEAVLSIIISVVEESSRIRTHYLVGP